LGDFVDIVKVMIPIQLTATFDRVSRKHAIQQLLACGLGHCDACSLDSYEACSIPSDSLESG
jgi:hypothetical protein